MSDQKKWFKVWASIIHDVKFQNMRLEDVGLWTLLGALMCEQGTNGKLEIIPPATPLLAMFRCTTIEDLKIRLSRLPNVKVFNASDPVFQNQHVVKLRDASGNLRDAKVVVESDNGTFIVIIEKWFKYQVDSTGYDRLKRSRYKKRREEKREESTAFLSERQDPKWT